jgi:hypothetical protein
MRLVLASNHFFGCTGSELTLKTLVSVLSGYGHDVLAWFPYLPDSGRASKVIGCVCTNSLEDVITFDPLVAYTQHYPVAMALRAAMPELAIIHALLGVLPHLERLPPFDLGISCVLPISEEVSEFNSLGVGRGPRSRLFRNIVDDQIFDGDAFLPSRPRAIVMSSYKLELRHVEGLTQYASNRGIKLIDHRPLVPGGDDYVLIPDRMRSADVVVASGRGAIEAMLCGRIPLILSNCGDDGLVTPKNFENLMRFNFSGRMHGHKFGADDIARSLDEYDASDAPVLQGLARAYFGSTYRAQDVSNLFNEVAFGPKPVIGGPDLELIRFLVAGFEQQKQFSLRTSEMVRSLAALMLSDAEMSVDELIRNGSEEWAKGKTDIACALFHRAFRDFPESAQAGRSLASNVLVQLASREKRAGNRAGQLAALLAFQNLNLKNQWVASQIDMLRLAAD